MGFFNVFVKLLLRSPLNGLLGNVMLVTVTGRRSGRRISTPVNYVRDADVLLVTSLRGRKWWRNLRGGAPVIVRLNGKEFSGSGEVAEDGQAVAEGLAEYLRISPGVARWFKVAVDSERRPDADDLARAAEDRVVARIRLEAGTDA